MPANNIIDALGYSWVLHVDSVASLEYDHPTFGLLEYRGKSGEPWLCDNVNTLHLTQQGSLPDGVMPLKVCIRPKYNGECGDYDLNRYDPPEDKCACADPECPQEHTLWLKCDTCKESDTQTVSSGGDPGLDCPNNPSYTMTSSLCGQTLKVTWYCCDGEWKADITVNGTFCETATLGPPATRCPLTMGTGVSNCDYLYVGCTTGCIGVDEDCTDTSLDCCDLTGVPSLTADNNAGSTLTLSDVGAGEYTGTGVMDVPVTLRYSCSGTTANLLVSFEPGSACFGDPPASYTGTIVGCDPMEVSFAGVDLCGTTRTITVTE